MEAIFLDSQRPGSRQDVAYRAHPTELLAVRSSFRRDRGGSRLAARSGAAALLGGSTYRYDVAGTPSALT